ncbi:AraC family transcriptional regulator [Chryseobacterium nematophagum]|uniref:AraC family transcriptional regulator n=1 Tax=Chryseobacterium nematophagum TaxID=2305228 RepID=A0A3M7TCY8_9FLAO|nr:AraC family transcriptional regulator [Chryseobacterium nematophagum]RNA61442.1 AraC family transcriptional regulator [Chryseobacterium nematophagum]
MKIEEEKIMFEEGLSFRLSFPSFKDYFFWHYHPEIELVYIEAPRGVRHVGRHISNFTNSDLVLIGPNVPHLNFDYNLKTKYNQVVIQIKTNLIDNILMNVPEFDKIKDLLERSFFGLSFKGDTKKEIGKRLKDLKIEEKLESFLELIKIFQILAESDEVEVLNTEDTRVDLFFKDKIRMGIIYKYIHENYHNKLCIGDLADIVHLTKESFGKYFKKQTDMTFTDFLNKYRINMAKTFLLQDISVGEVCYKVGFDSLSYFSTLFKLVVGETPTSFKKRFYRKEE